MSSVTLSTGGAATSFKYDGDGNLVAKLVGNVTTYYIGGVFEVEVTNAAVTKKTTYYPAGGALRVDIVGGSNTVYHVVNDHLGSASVTLDSTGNIAAEMRYYPFGETRVTSGAMPTDRLYTGQQQVANLGLCNYGARFYDPRLGRFISADTIVPQPGNPQTLSRYTYVNNNPVNATDPTGHEACYGVGPEIGSGISQADCWAWGRDTWIFGLPVAAPVAGEGYNTFLALVRGAIEKFGPDGDSLEKFAWVSEFAAYVAGNDTDTYMRYMTMAIIGWDPGKDWRVFLRAELGPNMDDADWLYYEAFTGQHSWRKAYYDDSDNQMYHFWFYVAVAYYNGTTLSLIGNLYHERPSREDLLKQGYPDWVANLGNDENTEISQEDYDLGLAGMLLGYLISKRAIKPSDVDDWLRVNLGEPTP